MIRTSPILILECLFFHPHRECRMFRYSFLQCLQKMSARTWTCFHCARWMSLISKESDYTGKKSTFPVRIIDGLMINGSSGSIETGVIGRELIIAQTSHMKVITTSCVRGLECDSSNIEFRIFLVTPIILSHIPPMWNACGTLNSMKFQMFVRTAELIRSLPLWCQSSFLHWLRLNLSLYQSVSTWLGLVVYNLTSLQQLRCV